MDVSALGKALGLAGLATALLVSPALSHHSFAMFDTSQSLSVQEQSRNMSWSIRIAGCESRPWTKRAAKCGNGRSKGVPPRFKRFTAWDGVRYIPAI